MATAKQLAALKKARAARKRNLAKKRKASSAPKEPTKKKMAVKRKKKITRSVDEFFIYARKGSRGTRYYLQKFKGRWVLNSAKPRGLSKVMFSRAKAAAARLVKRLPRGANFYVETRKKKR